SEAEGIILADEGRLRQLLENLIRNSVEHGSTSSRAEPDDSVEHGGKDVTVTVGTLSDGFYVADDGPGLPDDERDRAELTDFGVSPDGGTGIGLAIVERVAAAHGWTLEIGESAEGGFRATLVGAEPTR
ncbi:hypothetical protein DJ84_11445, partial [Halorubrum ezzemoulense]